MAKTTKVLNQAQTLREKAEQIVSAYPDDTNTLLSPEKIAQIVHELQVHQIELEMQNSELRSVQDELIRQKERYFDLYDLAPVGYITLTKEWVILEANLTASTLLGISRDKLIHQPFFRSIFTEDQDDFYLCRQKCLEANLKHTCEIRLLRKNAPYFWALIIIDFHNHEGDAGISMVISDITDKKCYEERLYRIGQYDSLTNLPNRLLLSDRLHQAMVQALRYERLLAVIYLDLDGFKDINDNYGHDIGDQVLIILANRMEKILREGDTIARLGGDEFVALLLNLERIEDTASMLNRFLDITNEPLEIGEHVLHVSASLGVTFFPQTETENIDADLLLRQADQAMYQAKLSGRNRYHIFDIDQDLALRERYEFIEIISHAIQNHEFILYFQPKVNMKTGAVIGAEALIRWNHPTKGILEPSAFLPIIEETHLAVEIGEWVIDAALTQIELWQNEELRMEVSVNVGAQQLQEDNFLHYLEEILSQHPNVDPSSLTLEILETSKIENLYRTTEIIHACRQLGVLFSLDDFGTGYSSLTYLQRLPIATIKIDQSFIRDMLNNVDDIAILSGIISLANAFHLDIIAEGVETIEHGELLLNMGCELAQGYAIARPMPPLEFSKWFSTWKTYPSWKNTSHHVVS